MPILTFSDKKHSYTRPPVSTAARATIDDWRRVAKNMPDFVCVDDAFGAEDDCCDDDDEDKSTEPAKTAISVLRNRLRLETRLGWRDYQWAKRG